MQLSSTDRGLVRLFMLGVLSQLAANAQLATASAAPYVPRFDHVVVVVMSAHSYTEIIGSASAPYINALATEGTSFTAAYAETSAPNQADYLALFSGSTQGVSLVAHCPNAFNGDSLGSQLRSTGLSFVGYSEGLPTGGDQTCSSGLYTRTHAPWVDFTQLTAGSLAAATSRPLNELPTDFTTLPTVAFIIPNLCNDMHGSWPTCTPGSIATGDTWLANSAIAAYKVWALSHSSLLIVTWDADDGTSSNHIPTLFVGAVVKPGANSVTTDHYRILATLETMYGLPLLGTAASAAPIVDIWNDQILADGFEIN